MDCSPLGSSVHGFPRQEYWSGLPFPSPGDRPDPGVKPMSLALQVGSLPLSHLGKPNGALGVCFDLWWIRILGAVNHATAVFPSEHFRDLQ